MTQKSTSISSANLFKRCDDKLCFAAQFSDGITVIYTYTEDQLNYDNMLSVGLSSSYIKTGKWPTLNNLKRREQFAMEWFTKNRKRYKLLRKK